jgi:anti-anti-sigma factor
MEITTQGTLTMLTLDGDIIAEDSTELREKIESLLRSRTEVKVLDLTGVASIDSFALGQIVYYCNNAGRGSGPVIILNRNLGHETYIDRLIEISELRQVFTIVDSLEAIGSASEKHGA